MGFLAEDYLSIFENGVYTNLGEKPPVLLGGDWNDRTIKDLGILIFNDDIDLKSGSDAYGEVIYEKQEGSLVAWATTREDRQKLKDDLIYNIENSGFHDYIASLVPRDFQDKYGFEMRIERTV